MVTGTVFNRHILLPITFRLPNQPDIVIEFVVDTGYTGFLTLPAQAVAAMNLPFIHRMPAKLADDSTIEIDVHEAVILWHGQETTVRVLATGKRPLLGTALLDQNELVAQFRDGGLTTVDAMDVV